MKTIRTIDLIKDIKQIGEWLYEEDNTAWVTVKRPENKNIVLMTEAEANELARARQNLEYLQKLDGAIEEARQGEAYEYFGRGMFSETPQRVTV